MKHTERVKSSAIMISPEVRDESISEQYPSSKPATKATTETSSCTSTYSSPSLLRKRVTKAGNEVTPPTKASVSLLRRVFSPSKSASASKTENGLDHQIRIDDAPSIRRNLSGLFQDGSDDHSMDTQPVESIKTSSVSKSVSKRIPCRFRKTKQDAQSSDDPIQEIVFEQATANESVFDSAWSSDDEEFEPTEPSSGSVSIKSVEPESTTFDKMYHMPTASRNTASPISSSSITPGSPLRNIKYFIDSGVRSMSKDMRRKSRISIKMQQKAHDDEANFIPLDEDSVKIFVLLVQPKQKIFELIQLIFSAVETTTVGDLLRAIPCNATQPDLANQDYIGLTRPKKRARDFTKLETPVRAYEDVMTQETVGISPCEIMVALPLGYSHNRVVAMSKKILMNPRIQKLLERTNPLAPRIRKSKRGQSPAIQMMEKVVEEPTVDGVDLDDSVKRAMEYAAQLSKQTQSLNRGASDDELSTAITPAALVSPTQQSHMTPKAKNIVKRRSVCVVPQMALTEESHDMEDPLSTAPGVLDAFLYATAVSPNQSFEAINGRLDDDTSINSSLCSSLQSYSSWSQSLESSLKMRASTPISSTPILYSANKQRVNPYLKQSWVSPSMVKFIVVRAGILYCIVMIVRYAMDPAECACSMEILQTRPLGVFGAVQVVLGFLTLVKGQHYMLRGRFQELPSAHDACQRRLSWAPSNIETIKGASHRRLSWAT